MPRIFKPNSTIRQPVYKPRNVDMTRNKDASCTVCIPFSADVVMGTDDRVCSIDALSLLCGSDSFNKFAQVFDEFKIQKYHCCIDLTKPQTSNLNTTVVMTPLAWNGNWNQSFTADDGNGPIDCNNVNFRQTLLTYLRNSGIIVPNGQGGYDRNYEQNTTGPVLYLLEILYQFVIENNVAVKLVNMYSLFNNNNYQFTDNQGNLGDVAFNIIGNPHVLNIEQKLANYQTVGACALRQVPKGFYGGLSSNQNSMNLELPDYFRYTDFLANQLLETEITDEEIESVGNYIHDSYMPGATVHLSLEVNGTSATEKSLYLPTNTICNIAQVDSFNQMGRFLPVGLLQNKVKNVEQRELLANGVFFEEHVTEVHDYLMANNNDVQNIQCNFVFAITGIDGNVYTITIPFFTAPLRNDINNQLMVVPDGPYTVIGYEGQNGGSFNINNNGLNWNGFQNHIYTDVSGGSIIYNTAADEDVNFGNTSSAFNIQCYITVRLRNVRNLLTNFVIDYPYSIIDCINDGLEIWKDDNNNPGNDILDSRNYGHNKALIKMTAGLKRSNINGGNFPAQIVNKDLKIIRQVYIGVNTRGFICHKYITRNTQTVFGFLDDQDQQNDALYNVLYGFAVQINPAYPQYCFKFNCFSLTDRSNVDEWLGVQAPNDAIFHLVWICAEVQTTYNNAVNVNWNALPQEGVNGWLDAVIGGLLNQPQWDKIKWIIDLSRMRSYGLCDGVTSNNVIELDCSPNYLNQQKNCIRDLNGQQTPNFSFVALGVRVGSIYNPVSNPEV